MVDDLGVSEDDREPHYVAAVPQILGWKVWRRRWNPLCGRSRFFRRQ
jgi:hypothetical protein